MSCSSIVMYKYSVSLSERENKIVVNEVCRVLRPALQFLEV